jgi:nitrite reductase/ring-hydroxylating ferredoxin subunit
MRHRLCATHEITDPGARGFSLMLESGPLDLFIVCSKGEFRAWRNSCPHRGTPLDWNPDEFLDDECEHIVCATHGAFFDIENGRCLSGPCNGQGLTPLRLVAENGSLFLETDQD